MSSRSKTLSVGFVVGSISRLAGGMFVSVRRTAQSLAAAGVAVTVYSLTDAHSSADSEMWYPLRLHLFPPLGARSFGYSPDLYKAIVAAEHDLLHQQGLWQLFSCATLAWRRRTGRPVMISPRGMLDPWALSNSKRKKQLAAALFERMNVRGANCIHALNESERIAISSFAPGSPIAVIPNGTDLPSIPRESTPPSRGKQVLLFLGRIHPKKGLSELIMAWNGMPGVVRDRWRLDIAGWDDGGHLAGLRQQVSSLQLHDSIRFLGPLHGDRKAQAFADASAFILPSRSEGLPMAVLEAWSAGLPVLMTRACNLPEGFVSQAAIEISVETAAFSKVLAESLMRDDLSQIGERGFQLVQKRYTWASVSAAHEATYRWMIGQGVAPSWVCDGVQ